MREWIMDTVVFIMFRHLMLLNCGMLHYVDTTIKREALQKKQRVLWWHQLQFFYKWTLNV